MRLLLDAHVSARRVAKALRQRGDDVLAADEMRVLDGCSDEMLLELAAGEGRVLVTFNVRDFARIARNWSECGREHSGCLMLVGIDHSQFGLIIRRIEEACQLRPLQEDWCDVAWLLGTADRGAGSA